MFHDQWIKTEGEKALSHAGYSCSHAGYSCSHAGYRFLDQRLAYNSTTAAPNSMRVGALESYDFILFYYAIISQGSQYNGP